MVASQISARTAQPPIGKPWRKGQSGNPGGRPKVAADVKAEARRYTKEALARLVHWMRSDDPQASIRASMALLDRGCGKPAQAVLGTLPDRPIVFTIDPFKNHREVMAARKRESEDQVANSPADPERPMLDGQDW